MPISELYKLPIVKQDDFRLYKEAVGLVTEEEKIEENERIIKMSQEHIPAGDDFLLGIIQE
jgi:exosome complex RNA-binding protein Rrp4